MLTELKKEVNITTTENGAVTLKTSGSNCLDLFATIGALRNTGELDIINRFTKAWYEDRDLALKILFYARDIRGGLGERQTFRFILRWLSENAPDSVRKNMHLISEFGRWDDLLVLLDSPCETDMVELVKRQFNIDIYATAPSLLAKWLPSVNASSTDTVRKAKKMAKLLGYSDAQYRKLLSHIRNKIRIIENNLREKDYTFDYEKQPSRAMLKYRQAFVRNDEDRYVRYIHKVKNGFAKMNTGTLTPYDIVHRVIDMRYRFVNDNTEREILDTMWHELEDFTRDENALVVMDGSGSMYSRDKNSPIDVAMSLAIYFAEHNKGEFHNHFITFSEHPTLVEIQGYDLKSKVDYCSRFNDVGNTNLQRVFDLILKTAVKNHLPQKDLPSTLYIISDMEFDRCTDDSSASNFEYAKREFAKADYILPRVVFWNVDSRNEQQPVGMNEQGVTLVSGTSPRVFSMVETGDYDPYSYMMKVLGTERYHDIRA